MNDDEEFFVGYLPTPPRTRRFASLAAAAFVSLALGAAVLGVLGAGTTAHGVENLAQTEGEGLVGLFELHPFAVLWVPREGGAPEPVLLVGGGKFGLGSSYAPVDGQIVRVQGLVMERDGQRMIETYSVPPTAELPEAVVASLRARAQHTDEDVVVEGEIVDEKCWLGRMRPGGGRTHRACAQLCVAGGIPPVMIGRDASGHVVHAVVVDAAGAPATETVLPFVAEPVRAHGALVHDGELTYLRLAEGGLERL